MIRGRSDDDDDVGGGGGADRAISKQRSDTRKGMMMDMLSTCLLP